MIRPLNEYVLLKKDNVSDKTKSGIIISSSKESNTATVVSIGNNCGNDIKVSQQVFYIDDKINNVVYNGEEYIIVKYSNIISVIE